MVLKNSSAHTQKNLSENYLQLGHDPLKEILQPRPRPNK